MKKKKLYSLVGVVVLAIIVAFAITLIGNKSLHNVAQNTPYALGGETSFSTQCLGEDETNRTCYSIASGTIGATTTGSFINTTIGSNGTGKSVILDKVEMYEQNLPKASSTVIVWAASSTQATSTISDFDFPRISTNNNILVNRGGGDSFPLGKIGVERYLISSTTIATGTRMVATSFFGESSSWNPTDPTMRNAATSTVLGYLDRIVFGISATTATCGAGSSLQGSGIDGRGTCGVASSTNDRGTVRWSVWYHYTQ